METKLQKLSSAQNNRKKNNEKTHVRCFELAIPTVASIMSHFVRHMLSESHFGWIYTDLQHELVDSTEEIADSRVSNDSLIKNKRKFRNIVFLYDVVIVQSEILSYERFWLVDRWSHCVSPVVYPTTVDKKQNDHR